MCKYVYFEPKGGFNDILCNITYCLTYCKNNQRILLVNGKKSVYNINFSEYFEIPLDTYIIFDINEIKKICLNNSLSIYPNKFQNRMEYVLGDTIKFVYCPGGGGRLCEDTKLELPDKIINEDIIIYSQCGSGNGFYLFKELIFKQNIMEICKERYKSLKKPYLGIHIRNTDYKCDYVGFFNKYEILIKSFTEVYIATDDYNVIQFFKEHGIQIKNFTTFPTKVSINLHSSNVDPHIKFVDMICDIVILSLSDKLISPSIGGFIKLVKSIMENNHFIELKND